MCFTIQKLVCMSGLYWDILREKMWKGCICYVVLLCCSRGKWATSQSLSNAQSLLLARHSAALIAEPQVANCNVLLSASSQLRSPHVLHTLTAVVGLHAGRSDGGHTRLRGRNHGTVLYGCWRCQGFSTRPSSIDTVGSCGPSFSCGSEGAAPKVIRCLGVWYYDTC